MAKGGNGPGASCRWADVSWRTPRRPMKVPESLEMTTAVLGEDGERGGWMDGDTRPTTAVDGDKRPTHSGRASSIQSAKYHFPLA